MNYGGQRMKRIFVASIIVFSLIMAVSSTALAQTIRIMPLGDSITEGERGSVPIGGFRDDLGVMLTNAGIDFQFVGSLDDGTAQYNRHEGHPGWRADQIDANVTTWLNNYTPDLVLLQIGTNDVSNDEPNAQTINDIENIIEKIKNYDTETPILICSTIPRNDAKNIDMKTFQGPIILPTIAISFMSPPPIPSFLAITW